MTTYLPHADRFAARHIGPSKTEVKAMIERLELQSLSELIQKTIPESILNDQPLDVPDAAPEHVVISDLRTIGRRNKIFRSYIGMGYHDTFTPRAILRAILENPSWYTQYTPYQAEISQGRLEALLNFQTAVIDLTGMEIANASLLDEGTAAAEAMMMFSRMSPKRKTFLVSKNCHPQTIAIVEARTHPLNIDLVVTDPTSFEFKDDVFGALVQYPGSDGVIEDYESLCEKAHQCGAYVAVAADLLSLALLRAPGEFGADAVVGNSQRFGVPLGYGGPHAAFFATKNAFRRQVPGRMIGVTVDIEGNPALRMALQMREQHIKRARATSNICTAQVLLAVMAGAYAVFHGPDGIRNIALSVHMWTLTLAKGLCKYGYRLRHADFFDTICVENPPLDLRETLQPNSGASGEYAGLLVIRAYFASKGESHRNVCLVPDSAHGTNPASAVMAGMKVVVIKTLDNGDIDHIDLEKKLVQHKDHLAALMITYPTTYGVFEEQVRELCDMVHHHGGQVYMDGANMNAQVGLCKPGDFGADVCHLNLHKTFAIPHGGGGPGVGPICVADHLAPFLPGHPVIPTGGEQGIGPVAAAPYGSASILLISWAYIALLGYKGLRRCSEIAILNANYLAVRLSKHYDILFRGRNGYVAHEFIIDLRPLKKSAGIDAVDVAKRLMDYGFHAPTLSWPVAGTMMIEPTESESKAEMDRFCDAMISIRDEIREIEEGIQDRTCNLLKNAPHTVELVCNDSFDFPYTRTRAAFPAPWTRDHKFWPTVRRIDEAYGDRNLLCACPPIENYQSSNDAE